MSSHVYPMEHGKFRPVAVRAIPTVRLETCVELNRPFFPLCVLSYPDLLSSKIQGVSHAS